ANGRVSREATLRECCCSFMAADTVRARSAATDAWYRRLAEPQRSARSRSLIVWHLSTLSPRLWTMRLQHGSFSAKRELQRLTLRSAVTAPAVPSRRH